jgi:AraC-like DNA-binding protein
MEFKELPGAWVLEAFRRGDVDLEVLSTQLPDDVELMLHEMDTILPDSINRLLQACAEISGNQNFGLVMNELVDLTMYGLFGYLLLNCSTVHDLFATLVRYHTVHHNGGITYEMVTQDDTAVISICHDERTLSDHRHTTEWGLGFIPDFLRPPLGDLSVPLRARFINKPPENLEKLRDYFGENLEFNQADDQLIYPKSILEQRISNVDPHLLNVLRMTADNYLVELRENGSLLQNTKAILFDKLGEKKCNAPQVAQALNISTSTFKRKLAEEGVDFKKAKDSVRNELAKNLLSKSDVQICHIAQNVGFTNQSSFTRFFVRCNHQTPQNFRASKRPKKIKR